jgi:hypothetical protein
VSTDQTNTVLNPFVVTENKLNSFQHDRLKPNELWLGIWARPLTTQQNLVAGRAGTAMRSGSRSEHKHHCIVDQHYRPQQFAILEVLGSFPLRRSHQVPTVGTLALVPLGGLIAMEVTKLAQSWKLDGMSVGPNA